jgi:translocation and assembly module TamB
MGRVRAIIHAHVAAAIFVVALVGGALLHLAYVPLFARLVVASVNRALDPLFLGHVYIDRVRRIGFGGAMGLDGHVDDTQGRRMLTLEGIDARLSTFALLRSLPSKGPIDVDIPDVSVAHAFLELDPDETGVPRIARAFGARSPTQSTGKGRSVRLALPHAHIARLSIHAPPVTDDAELDGADASLLLSDDGLVVDIGRGHLDIRGLPRGAQASGIVQAHFEQPASGARLLRASWEGAVGAVVERADVTLRGQDLDASLDVSPVGSAEVCVLLPEWPIAAVCSAHAEAHGTLPHLTVGAQASVGGGTVDISGQVTLGSPVQATAHFDIRKLDGRSLVSPIPCSSIDVGGDVSVEARPTGEVIARGNLGLTSAQCGSHPLPPAAVTVDFTRAAQGNLSGHADVTIHEPGAPTVLSLRLNSSPERSELSFEAATNAASLETISALEGTVSGRASVHATGTIDLRALSIDARASGSVADLRARDVAVTTARMDAHATGPLLRPSIAIEVEAESVSAPAVSLAAVSMQGRMTLDGGVGLHDVQIDFAGDGPPIRATATLFSFVDGTVRLDSGLVEGLGAPLTTEVRGSAAGVTLRAKSAGIDLERVASFASIPARGGKLSLDLDTTVTASSAEGRVAIDLSHGVIGSLRNVDAHLEAVLHGRGGSGHATATVDDIAALEAHSTSLALGRGGLLTAAPWRRAWGQLDLTAHADLSRLVAHLPAAVGAIGSLQGQLAVTARVARDSERDVTPEVNVTVRTAGLVVSRPQGSGAWRLDGIDPVLRVVVDGDTGKTTVDAGIEDATGAIATLKATSSSVPYAAIFSDEGVADALLATPFAAALEVPERSLASMPAALGMSGRRGDLKAHVDWHGAVIDPTLSFTASLMRGHADPKLVALPVDVSLSGRYQGSQLDVTLQGTQHGVQVVEGSGQLKASAGDWVARGTDASWTASGKAHLDRLPLRSFDVLDDKQVRGTVSGDLILEGLHENARASAQLDFESLQVGDVDCKSSQINASVDEHGVQATARIDQVDGGFAVAELRAGGRWGSALLPQLDPTEPANGSLKATNFRAELLLPWLSGVTELDGRIDGSADVQIDPQRQLVRPRGTLALRDGTLEIGFLGTEFHGVSGKATLTPDGIVRVENVVARGTTGRVTAAATAWMTGLSLGGASAVVQIPSSEALPLVYAGVQLGKIEGRFDMKLTRSSRENHIDVNMPSMTLELPAGSANRDVQDLGEVSGVRVGRLRSSEFVLEHLDAANDDTDVGPAGKLDRPLAIPTVIDVELGQEVEVRKGTDLDVRLEGHPKVTIGSNVRVSGQIRMTRGSIDVQGKPFEIEKGTVTFVEADPSNPQVVLTAGWSAPDGTRVYADFVGPLKTGKVTLRSEPARPQNEILALILFGTTDDQNSGGSQQASTMAAAAGGVATQPLNQALGGVNHALDKLGLAGGISTKVDTSTPNPRPEVEVQIARDVSLQVAWVLGAPPPGTNPDTTLVTLDWRFLRKWALETTVGDQGTSIVDVVWQHRY